MRNLGRTIMTSCILFLLHVQSFAQLQDRLYAGINNSGTNLEICYSVTNTVSTNLTLSAESENQITILYGKAPLNGYFTEANACLDILSYNLSSVHPDINPASFIATETESKFLWFNFRPKNELTVNPGNEIELFCFEWTIESGGCSDLVYWTFCDTEVADTYYNDYAIFPLGSDCTEGDPQTSNLAPVLPVTLSAFSGENNVTRNIITWSTESEINNNYFSLEKSIDGIDFELIAHVQSKGNSNKNTEYTFADTDIQTGRNYYYRISQTDFDGTYTQFSKIINVTAKRGNEKLNLFPVPAHDYLSLEFDNSGNETCNFLVFNSNGETVIKDQLSKDVRTINLSNLEIGFYSILIIKENETFKKKFLKI